MKNIHAKKDPYAAYERHSERDWAILACFSFLITIAVLAGGAYLYGGISDGTLFTGATGPTNLSAVLDSKKLDAIVRSYEARAAQFSALQTNDPKVVDPSL